MKERRGGAGTVVLVSDGIETCGGYPCQTAGQLKTKGVDVIIHVVGFDVDQKAAEQLACIAEAVNMEITRWSGDR